MNISQHSVAPHSRQVFFQWYRVTTLGQILQNIEASYLQHSVKLTYKQKILQVGVLGSEDVYIPAEFREQLIIVSPPSDGASCSLNRVAAEPSALPVASCSIDLLIVPHLLEFEADPHQVLREIERILKPEGQLFVLCFNPLSLHGIVQYLPRRDTFWRPNFIPHHRLLDWLRLLKFDAEYHAAFSTTTAEVIAMPQNFLTRYRAYVSFAYAIRAIKRTYTVIPIEPSWIPTPSILTGQVAETLFAHDGVAHDG